MSTTESTLARRAPASRAELALWLFGTFVGGVLLILGLGIVVGLVLAFTRLSGNRPLARWSVLTLGVATLVLQVIGLQYGSSSFELGPAVRS